MGGAVPDALAARCDRVWERLLAACRPGAPASDLLDGYTEAGKPLPPMPVARGLGLGFDPPVVTGGLPRTARDERIEAGMVLALTGYVSNRAPERSSAATPCWSRATVQNC